MRIVIVGPGRAGGALALAVASAAGKGWDVAGIVGRDRDHGAPLADRVGAPPWGLGDAAAWQEAWRHGPAFVMVATRDDAVSTVAERLALVIPKPSLGVAHMSGALPVTVLAPVGAAGHGIGSFHPLQTLPNPDDGARRLAGAWVGITASGDLRDRLESLAAALGMHSFELADAVKPVYHAAAAAAANFTIADLAIAHDLFTAADVPFEAARPLVEAVVANAFELGLRAALTGPVARGDIHTVRRQVDAVERMAPRWGPAFRSLVAVVAAVAGREDEVADMLPPPTRPAKNTQPAPADDGADHGEGAP